ncbi:hypothetical protein GCM10022254_74990 [Actinomadura meridiana]|uniref:Uncharacterized protein n=1 Tax=Actinomadura meridiana TaxID=559626 RepID=A0ABP8CR43_9ACTN
MSFLLRRKFPADQPSSHARLCTSTPNIARTYDYLLGGKVIAGASRVFVEEPIGFWGIPSPRKAVR